VRSNSHPANPAPEITQLLQDVTAGSEHARKQLFEIVYSQLRRIAGAHLRRERAGHTLAPTALVHEAYLKMFGGAEIQFVDRVHFFAMTSRVMRQILVDYGRTRARLRRGGEGSQVTLSIGKHEGVSANDAVRLTILDLDRALDALAREKESLAEVVEMQYFAGMTADEIAEAAGRSVHIVRHEIRLAQAWLRRALATDATS